jgi:NAD(P)-dependent dehydrogenase (short-subunit alcohol dehydrogenase family)
MHVLVTGAAGKVGQAFLARFHAEAAGDICYASCERYPTQSGCSAAAQSSSTKPSTTGGRQMTNAGSGTWAEA